MSDRLQQTINSPVYSGGFKVDNARKETEMTSRSACWVTLIRISTTAVVKMTKKKSAACMYSVADKKRSHGTL